MHLEHLKFLFLGAALCLIPAPFHQVNATAAEGTPPPRDIPGITSGDMFPGGCVNCHLNFTDRNMDTRISTSLVNWEKKVDPE